MTEKVYELTTNAKDGFAKWLVRGIKDDAEAKQIALKGFGKKYVSTLITHYDDYPSKYSEYVNEESLTIPQFLKEAKKQYG